ncbi:hypothetical protein GCM10020000_79270 [Streptomyces olivoverticillatus]
MIPGGPVLVVTRACPVPPITANFVSSLSEGVMGQPKIAVGLPVYQVLSMRSRLDDPAVAVADQVDVVGVLQQRVRGAVGDEQVLGLHQGGEPGGVAVDDDPRVRDLVGGVHPAGEHGQDGGDDGVAPDHQRRLGPPPRSGRAKVQLGVGGEGRGEQLLVLEVLAQAEAVERIGDFRTVTEFRDGRGRVVGGGRSGRGRG